MKPKQMKSVKIHSFHLKLLSYPFQLLWRFSARTGGLDIVLIFSIPDADVCHEAYRHQPGTGLFTV